MVKSRSFILQALNPYITPYADFTEKDILQIREAFQRSFPDVRVTNERILEKLSNLYLQSMFIVNTNPYLVLSDAELQFLQDTTKIIHDNITPILKDGKAAPTLVVSEDVAGNKRVKVDGFIADKSMSSMFGVYLLMMGIGKAMGNSERTIEKYIGYRFNDEGHPVASGSAPRPKAPVSNTLNASVEVEPLGGPRLIEFECVLRNTEQPDGSVIITQEELDKETRSTIGEIKDFANIIIPECRMGKRTIELREDGALVLTPEDKQLIIDHIHQTKELYRLAPAAIFGDFTLSQYNKIRRTQETNAHPDLEKFLKAVEMLASYEVDSNKVRRLVAIGGTMEELIDGLSVIDPELPERLHYEGDSVKLDKRHLGRLMESVHVVINPYLNGDYDKAYQALLEEREGYIAPKAPPAPAAVRDIIEDHGKKAREDFMMPLADAQAVLGLGQVLEDRLKAGKHRSTEGVRLLSCKDDAEIETLQSLCLKLVSDKFKNEITKPFAAQAHDVKHPLRITDNAYGAIKGKLAELYEYVQEAQKAFPDQQADALAWRQEAVDFTNALQLSSAEQTLLPSVGGRKKE